VARTAVEKRVQNGFYHQYIRNASVAHGGNYLDIGRRSLVHFICVISNGNHLFAVAYGNHIFFFCDCVFLQVIDFDGTGAKVYAVYISNLHRAPLTCSLPLGISASDFRDQIPCSSILV